MARDKFVDDAVFLNIYENDMDEAYSLWGPFPFPQVTVGEIWLCKATGFPEVIAGEDVDRFFNKAVAAHTTGDFFHVRVDLGFGVWHTAKATKTENRWVVVYDKEDIISGERVTSRESAEEVIREIWQRHIDNLPGREVAR